MNDFNKGNMKWGLKVLLLFIWAILTIAVCAGVWNFVSNTLLCIAAGALLASNAFVIWRIGRKIFMRE